MDQQETKITIQVSPEILAGVIGEGAARRLRTLGSALSSKENPINVDILK